MGLNLDDKLAMVARNLIIENLEQLYVFIFLWTLKGDKSIKMVEDPQKMKVATSGYHLLSTVLNDLPNLV